jgi:methyl-accepting chemotaxis protein
MMSQLSLKAKLWILTSAALAALFATVLVGIMASSSLSRSASDLSEKYLETMLVLNKARSALAASNSTIFKFTNEIRAGQTEQTVKQKMAEIQAALSDSVKRAQEADAALEKATLSTKTSNNQNSNLLADLTASYQKKILESLDVIVLDVSVGGMMLMTTEEDYAKAARTFDEREKSVEKAVLTNAAAAVKLAQDSQRLLLLAGVVGFCILAVIAALTIKGIRNASNQCIEFTNAVARGDLLRSIKVLNRRDEFGQIVIALESMQQSLRQKANAAVLISQGNLDCEITRTSEQDELGKALVDMRDSLRTMLQNITHSFQKVAEEMDTLNGTSDRLRNSAQDQAASIEEISASVAEIAQRSRQNTQATQNAKTLVGSLSEISKSSQQKMTDLANSMVQVQNSSKAVSAVIKSIDDIAFQTNLLALNAAVEAARAGKHGKGFAVVAEEVRALASRSARAAGDSTELVEGSLASVSAGMTITQEATSGYGEVLREVEKVNAEIVAVSAASTEQLRELTQVSQAVNHIGAATVSTAAFAEEVADTTIEVRKRANEVAELLSRFRMT